MLLWQIIAGRAITGLGGAGMVALISVIITDNVLPSQVALTRSYVNTVNTIGRAFGGPLGAAIADTVGWRWSFISQAPTALLCGIFCMLLLTTTEGPGDKSSDRFKNSTASPKIDFLGIITFAIAITSLLALIESWGKGKSESSLVLLGATVGFGVLFLLIEAYYAEQPLIPLSLLKTTSAIYMAIQVLLLFGRQAHLASLSPYFLWTRDISATKAATYLIPSSIGFTFGSIIAGVLIQRFVRDLS
ncbi:unnamed protein product [Penicillium egyptiacum]|uniref:Major facilitator superfamily (MFS) profile domain-containing protein n=1 Tax=Penicillium egyptiacum TaxID=1303716 RepID=A0A9W4KPB0_9EURO|nr:unnamed protein product [Penicillium egyptiacum]